jgi:ABC-type transport system involved in multi-copper enzyme maturation permease subunit
VNRGVMYKALREIWMVTVALAAALMFIEGLLAYVLPILESQFQGIFAEMPFVRTIMKALLGTDMGEGLGVQGIQAIAWVHPVVLALVWAHGIIVCTRVPAGEIDRGTADVLFGLPVSRWEVFVSETIVWLVALTGLIVCAFAGSRLGAALEGKTAPVPLPGLLLVLFNLWCLAAAVGALAWLCSALSDRRGRAMAIVFAIIIASFLLNFLAQFWEPAKSVMFLGVLNYHRPMEVIRHGALPLQDVLVLLGVAATAWTAGGIALARRDIATV